MAKYLYDMVFFETWESLSVREMMEELMPKVWPLILGLCAFIIENVSLIVHLKFRVVLFLP